MIEIVSVIVTAVFILAVVGGLLFWLVRLLLRFRALSPQSRRYSLAIADLGMALPSIPIRPERLGDRLRRDLAFEWEDFNRAFEVRCEDRAFAFALLDARMMEWMMGTGDRYSFEVKGDKVLVSCRLLAPARMSALLDVATGFCERVPLMLRSRYGRPEYIL